MIGRLTLALLALALAVVPSALASGGYTFTTVDYPGAADTAAYAINDHGDIVGSYGDNLDIYPGHAFLLSKGTFTTTDFPGSTLTFPYGINNHRQVVGAWAGSDLLQHGFKLRARRMVFKSVDAPCTNTNQSLLYGINNVHEAIAVCLLSDGSIDGSFVNHGKHFTAIPAFPGSFQSLGSGINDSGDILGIWVDPNQNTFHGYLLVQGKFTQLDDPDAGQTNCTGIAPYGYENCSTAPSTINNLGQAVGWFVDGAGAAHGFLLSNGTYTTIDVPGAVVTNAFGINNAGQIVGYYIDASGVAHGFLATPQ